MKLAQVAWEDAQVGRLLELLGEHKPKPGEPDLRGFEWHYWNNLASSYLLNLKATRERSLACGLARTDTVLGAAGLAVDVAVLDTTTES
jgi:hypothetical protein